MWQKLKASVFPVKEPIFAAAPTQKPEALAGQFAPPPPTYAAGNEKSEFIFTEGEISLATEVTSAKKPNLFDKITSCVAGLQLCKCGHHRTTRILLLSNEENVGEIDLDRADILDHNLPCIVC